MDDAEHRARGRLDPRRGRLRRRGRRRRRSRRRTSASSSAARWSRPGLVNTHHHLYQTLTRARAQQATLFEWLVELYPTWARIDAEAEYAAARTGIAELMLSGCTTVFDHHYVFPRGRTGLVEAEVQAAPELGCRLVASRGSMDLGVSDGGLPPGRARRGRRRRARRHRAPRRRAARDRTGCAGPDRGRAVLAVLRHRPADDRVGRARAPPRAEAAHASRRDGRGGGVLQGAVRLHAGRVPRLARLAGRRRLVRALRPPLRARDRAASPRPAPASPTARPRTSGSAPASRRCGS